MKVCQRCGKRHGPEWEYAYGPQVEVDAGYARDAADRRRLKLSTGGWRTSVVRRKLKALGQEMAVLVIVTRRRVPCTRPRYTQDSLFESEVQG
jgi:hypothetical protein